jgi:hypothetical protein
MIRRVSPQEFAGRLDAKSKPEALLRLAEISPQNLRGCWMRAAGGR